MLTFCRSRGFLVLAGLLGPLFAASSARAAFFFNVLQVGSNVDVVGSGSLDLTDLTQTSVGSFEPGAAPGVGELNVGPVTDLQVFSSITGPSGFGTISGFESASSSSGSTVDLIDGTELGPPSGYRSDTFISDSDTFDNSTLATLGLTNSTYTYTWGTGVHADSLTVNIGTAVPEPLSVPMTVAGTVVLMSRRPRGRTTMRL